MYCLAKDSMCFENCNFLRITWIIQWICKTCVYWCNCWEFIFIVKRIIKTKFLNKKLSAVYDKKTADRFRNDVPFKFVLLQTGYKKTNFLCVYLNARIIIETLKGHKVRESYIKGLVWYTQCVLCTYCLRNNSKYLLS